MQDVPPPDVYTVKLWLLAYVDLVMAKHTNPKSFQDQLSKSSDWKIIRDDINSKLELLRLSIERAIRLLAAQIGDSVVKLSPEMSVSAFCAGDSVTLLSQEYRKGCLRATTVPITFRSEKTRNNFVRLSFLVTGCRRIEASVHSAMLFAASKGSTMHSPVDLISGVRQVRRLIEQLAFCIVTAHMQDQSDVRKEGAKRRRVE